MALYVGEDFELLFTLSPERLESARRKASFTVIGEVIPEAEGVRLEESDGQAGKLPDRGYEHG